MKKPINLRGLLYLAGYKNVREFAEEVGISAKTLYLVINGHTKEINFEKKIKIVEVLNKKLAEAEVPIKLPLSIYELFPELEKIPVEIFGEKRNA